MAKKRKQNEKEIRRICCEDLCSLHGFVTYENEGWCVQTPEAFLYKSLLASFCLQYTSTEFFYRPYNFHFDILSSFEIIAKTLSVALEVPLSIFYCKRHKWKYIQMFTVYYFIVPLPCFNF